VKSFDPSYFACGDIQYGDIRILQIELQQITVKNGKITYCLQGNEKGALIRMMSRGTWGFCSTTDISVSGLEKAVHRAYHTCNSIPGSAHLPVGRPVIHADSSSPPRTVDAQPIELLQNIESALHCSPLVKEGRVGMRLRQGVQDFWNTEGSDIQQNKTEILIDSQVVTRKGGKSSNSGFTFASTDVESLPENTLIEKAEKTAEEAISTLDTQRPPNGEFCVILGPSLASIFIHEAVGHRLEADEAVKPRSIMGNKRGTVITHPAVMVRDTVDEGELWYTYDDEGICKRETVLIEGGEVRGFLHDRQTAHLLHEESTGNSRASGYETQPLVRMTNITVEPGDMSNEEMIEECDTGLFLDGFVGGAAVAGGAFRFAARGGYRIDHGDRTTPVGRSIISGSTLSSLAGIQGVGTTCEMYHSECLKKGQSVLVGLGSPALLISDLRVGG